MTTAASRGTPTGTRAPGRPALVDPRQPELGPDIGGEVAAVLAELRRRGLRPGDRVLVKGGNSARLVVCLLALMHADASLVIVDPHQTALETAAAVSLSQVAHLVADEPGPGVWDLAGLFAAEPVSATAPLSLTAWLSRADAAVLWSSGTTGPPKGVVKPGPALRENTERTLDTMGYHPGDVLAPWLPFSHQYGLSLLLLWWFTGCTLVVAPYQRLGDAVELAAQFQATVLDATPATYHTLLRMLERRPRLRDRLARVRLWCVGGAPLPAPLAAAFREVTGKPLLDGYGSTELGNVALAIGDHPVGCGRPLPRVEVRILGEDGEPVPDGTVGEVLVRSPGLMSGYLTAEGFQPYPPGHWFRTEDIGKLDADGNLHVLGRRRAVHRNGYTLYPEGLERKAEACGAPVKVLTSVSGRRGTSLTFVVADPRGRAARYWRERLTAVLAVYEHPNIVRVVSDFPVTGHGKVDNGALRELVGL